MGKIREMRYIKPVAEKPVSILDEKLIISDLHLGIERSLEEEGIRVPNQTDRLKKRINKIIEEIKPEEIILLGDVKNQVPGLSWQERKEIPLLLKFLSEKVNKIRITPGNHDGKIGGLVPDELNEKVCIEDTRGLILDKAAFLHGHTWPKKNVFKKEEILIGHNHPVVSFEDEFERIIDERCWIEAKLKKKPIREKYGEIDWNSPSLIIQPAFNDLTGGISFNSPSDSFLGPFFNSGSVSLKESKIYLLDGTYLGKLGQLNKPERKCER
ncbi:MAG: Phosphohydrolase Icc/MPP superfamily [Candidatus Methanohalarchaeum thermophilum]|uniref:Phosphohydrolase Icc/MPP superfamily n=1 Tax=Methanohalarchaeum thermophilum TaxID=1903181 RepID=A0A1Q6DX96_METT1|nr:MAG: Phosphohydrolase Icc/MPP superfamily [Candidatus Methanohalarchaeum thermophilum]